NICDDEPASFAVFTKGMASAIGARPPKSIPAGVAKAVMPYFVLAMTGTVTMSNAKAKSELGWKPRYPSVREGLSEMRRSA
ncbi:MAG: NAD-dependent epimerase/dehydratase family protein, partial [Actinomycetota bacterium]